LFFGQRQSFSIIVALLPFFFGELIVLFERTLSPAHLVQTIVGASSQALHPKGHSDDERRIKKIYFIEKKSNYQ
jgi:hypothetical protein